MKVIELFAGTRSIGRAFERKGHEVFSVEWNKKFKDIDLYADVSTLTAEDVVELVGAAPDVLWASPDCATYSVAGLAHNRNLDKTPKTEYGAFCDKCNYALWNLIYSLLDRNQKMVYFVENPRGLYRKMPWVEKEQRFTVTYCSYGDFRMKPTDIFTNAFEPRFKQASKNYFTDHEASPRHSWKTGTNRLKEEDRSRIPDKLCDYIVELSEREIAEGKRAYGLWQMSLFDDDG